MPLSHANLEAAIENGIHYLHQTQHPEGSFEAVCSSHQDMRRAQSCPQSAYTTAGILHTLAQVEPTVQSATICETAANFLMKTRTKNGGWRWYEGCESALPTDLNTTACAIAALAQLGKQPELSFYALLWQNESTPGGPYHTWLEPDVDDRNPLVSTVDSLTNANIVFCCGLLGLSLPKTVYYLEQVISAEAYESESRFTQSPHYLVYLLSRAYADGQIKILHKVMPTMQDYILSRLPAPHVEKSIFNLACLAVSLLNIKVPSILVRPYLVPLLTEQQGDGGWDLDAAYLAPTLKQNDSPSFNGSRALTTAIAIEALHKYYAG